MKSVIDKKLSIKKDQWVVSILRKPNGSNPEHAFLIVEGANSFNQGIIRRYDLFVDRDNKKKSFINIKESEWLKSDEREEQLNLFLGGENVYARSWQICEEEAKTLHKNVIGDSTNPPDYQLSGNRSLVAKSSLHEGHSCFTWAREKLLELNNPKIDIEIKIKDFIAAQTSLYIQPSTDQASKDNVKSPTCLLL